MGLHHIYIYTPTCRAGRGALRQIVRVGHPARLLPAVVGVSLDAKLAASDGGAIVRDIKKEIDDAQAERRLVGVRVRVLLMARHAWLGLG